MAKQYGLILPNKTKLTPANEILRPSVFNEDSDSDGEDQKPTGVTKNLKRQDRVAIERAVEEDPTVYQYDEVYDEIDRKRKDSKLSRTDLEKKPKYISRLLAAAEKRKRENERRIERQVQKEREAEGEEFGDKESFVTSAYRRKLEEFKKMEEEEKREEYLESIGDVTKQGNLDGFYRHLYDQKVNYEEAEEDKEEKSDDAASPRNNEIKKVNRKRRYRRRESTNSEENKDEECQKKLEHLPSNLDADSDFSIDSDTSESETEGKLKKVKKENDEEATTEKKEEPEVKSPDKNEEDKDLKEVKAEEKPKKPKVDIWKKRTVGIVFDEALQRYFERKALKEVAVN